MNKHPMMTRLKKSSMPEQEPINDPINNPPPNTVPTVGLCLRLILIPHHLIYFSIIST